MFTIDVFIEQNARGLHVRIRGLEAGRILSLHFKTPDRLGLASFIGTVGGVAKPIIVNEKSVEEEKREAECEKEKK